MKFSEYLIENESTTDNTQDIIDEINSVIKYRRNEQYNKMERILTYWYSSGSKKYGQKINGVPETVQLAAVKINPHIISEFSEQYENVQLVAVKQNFEIAAYGEYLTPHELTPKVLQYVLTNEWFIKDSPDEYNEFVKEKFASNQILMNKWLKYGETIRNAT